MRERLVFPFWNRETRRVRAPWRLVAVFVVIGLFGLVVAAATPLLRDPLVAAVQLLVPGPQGSAVAGNVVFLVAQLVGTVGGVYVVGRFLDCRRFADFGLHLDRDWWADLGFGLLLGAALMTTIVLVELAAGWLTVTDTFRIARSDFSFWTWFGFALANFVVIGVVEELLARGFLIKNAAEGLTWFEGVDATRAVGVAVVASGLLFAVGHATNPNAGVASTVGIFVAAFMLAAGYVLTGELAIPIGIHVTWNFFQGTVYGLPVSGMDFGISLLAVEQSGPALVTGGSFGPEAGLLGVSASLVGIALVGAWVRWRGGALQIHPSITTPDRRG